MPVSGGPHSLDDFMKAIAPTHPVMLVSPHLDDGVFSCGDLLDHSPGTQVVTVFAGTPPADMATDWDARCGFSSATVAMRARRDEDLAALTHLGARPRWLDFLDAQYAPPPAPADIAAALHAVIDDEGPRTVLVPMGLFHSDHVLVSDAATLLAARRPDLVWIVYEDALYRTIDGLVQQRLAALAARGFRMTPMRTVAAPSARKGTAIRCYASQLPALGDAIKLDLADPERFWSLDHIAEGHA
jgi:LmbE family N-acetylglucosaminyl deacetylase